MPLMPAFSPAVTTVGRPFSGEKLASLSPPQKNGSMCDPVVPLRWNSTQSFLSLCENLGHGVVVIDSVAVAHHAHVFTARRT